MFFRVINGFRALFLGVLLLACLASFAAVGVAWWNVLGVLLLGYYTLSNAVAAFGRSGGRRRRARYR